MFPRFQVLPKCSVIVFPCTETQGETISQEMLQAQLVFNTAESILLKCFHTKFSWHHCCYLGWFSDQEVLDPDFVILHLKSPPGVAIKCSKSTLN